MITRRHMLALVGLASTASLLPRRLTAATALPETTRAALAESDLVYITPLKSNGEESRCHAEIWFVHHEGDVYVVTASDAWRTKAIGSGLTRARLWVGDYGTWTESKEKFREAPGFDATASITAAEQHASVLDVFGRKYSMEWLVWGPRFKNGLADGSRAMLRYRPALA